MLIGSRAIEKWVPYPIKETTDYDIITDDPPSTDLKVEIHRPDQYLSQEFVDRFATDYNVRIGDKWYPICSLRGLSAIKMSHLSLDHNWIKHISCFHKFLKPHFNPRDWELVEAREKITLDLARQKAPSLMMDNVDFFDDAVQKKYDHDWLHERVAFYDRPLYERLKFSHKLDLAWCEKDLWDQFSHEDKLKCVVEEASVIALERFLLPGLVRTPVEAYNKALRKVCTSLTSGWFRSFAIWNWPELRVMCRTELLNNLTKELKYAN